MALTTTQIQQLNRIFGAAHLISLSNPDSATAPGALDEDVLEVAVERCEAWFARRGYTLTRANVELLGWVDVFLRPRHLWSDAEKEKWQEMHTTYPETLDSVGATSTGVAAGDADDRRHFTDTKLDSLDRIRVRQTHNMPGGDL